MQTCLKDGRKVEVDFYRERQVSSQSRGYGGGKEGEVTGGEKEREREQRAMLILT